MKRKIVSLMLALLLVVAVLPLNDNTAYAEMDEFAFTGADCTTSKTAAAAIDYVLAKYPAMSEYPGSGTCWGYAETVSKLLSSSRSTNYYSALKFTKENFKEKCLNARAGTHLRISNNKTYSGYSGHSIVLFKVTEDLVCWGDNNGARDNRVRYHSGTLDDFMNFAGFTYINMVSKPKGYKAASTPKLVATSGQLNWLKTSSASSYNIYRSSSKNGTYKKIATTQKTNYYDNTAPIGKKSYYKIKAVKSSKSVYGNIDASTFKLRAPVINLTNDPQTGDIVISWDAVERADAYKIYRVSHETWLYEYLETTTECQFVDSYYYYAEEYGCAFKNSYKIKAVYNSNSSGNSKYSNEVLGMCLR